MGRRRPSVWFLALFLIVFASACATTRRAEPTLVGTATREACFNVRTVDSFSPLHEMFVYLRSLDGKHYLLTLDRIYTSLPFATGITLYGAFGRVCSNTGAMITYTHLGHRVFCRIVRVEAVASKEAAKSVVRERTPRGPKG